MIVHIYTEIYIYVYVYIYILYIIMIYIYSSLLYVQIACIKYRQFIVYKYQKISLAISMPQGIFTLTVSYNTRLYVPFIRYMQISATLFHHFNTLFKFTFISILTILWLKIPIKTLTFKKKKIMGLQNRLLSTQIFPEDITKKIPKKTGSIFMQIKPKNESVHPYKVYSGCTESLYLLNQVSYWKNSFSRCFRTLFLAAWVKNFGQIPQRGKMVSVFIGDSIPWGDAEAFVLHWRKFTYIVN